MQHLNKKTIKNSYSFEVKIGPCGNFLSISFSFMQVQLQCLKCLGLELERLKAGIMLCSDNKITKTIVVYYLDEKTQKIKKITMKKNYPNYSFIVHILIHQLIAMHCALQCSNGPPSVDKDSYISFRVSSAGLFLLVVHIQQTVIVLSVYCIYYLTQHQLVNK